MRYLLAVLLVVGLVGGCSFLPRKAAPVAKVAMPETKGLEVVGSMPTLCGEIRLVFQGTLDADHKPGYNVVYRATEGEGGVYVALERPFLIVDFDVVGDEVVPQRAYIDRDEDGLADEVLTLEQLDAKYGERNLCVMANKIFGK